MKSFREKSRTYVFSLAGVFHLCGNIWPLTEFISIEPYYYELGMRKVNGMEGKG